MSTVINRKGRQQGKKLGHAENTESDKCPLYVLKIGREFAREIYEDCTVIFHAQQASDRLG